VVRRRADPRHAVSWARPSGVRLLLSFAGAIFAGTLVAGSAASATFALWNDTGAMNASTISSGSLSLSVTATFNSTLWSDMISGEAVRQSFSVTNTGTIPTRVSVSVTGVSTGYEIRVTNGSCGTVALAGVAANISPTELYPTTPLAAGATGTQCLEVRLVAAAAAGSSSAFTATVTANQVQP
jgi:hypothetical protein